MIAVAVLCQSQSKPSYNRITEEENKLTKWLEAKILETLCNQEGNAELIRSFKMMFQALEIDILVRTKLDKQEQRTRLTIKSSDFYKGEGCCGYRSNIPLHNENYTWPSFSTENRIMLKRPCSKLFVAS